MFLSSPHKASLLPRQPGPCGSISTPTTQGHQRILKAVLFMRQNCGFAVLLNSETFFLWFPVCPRKRVASIRWNCGSASAHRRPGLLWHDNWFSDDSGACVCLCICVCRLCLCLQVCCSEEFHVVGVRRGWRRSG